jgi:Flp pilus assembly protein TadD
VPLPGWSELPYIQPENIAYFPFASSGFKALKINPHYAEAHNNLGAALDDRGKRIEAIELDRKALQINPDYADAHNNLGVALAIQGISEEAVNHFREALRLNPHFEGALANMGNAMAEQGNLKDAEIYFYRALQINPADEQVRRYLERIQRKQAKTGS